MLLLPLLPLLSLLLLPLPLCAVTSTALLVSRATSAAALCPRRRPIFLND